MQEWVTLGEGRYTASPAGRVAHIAAQMWRGAPPLAGGASPVRDPPARGGGESCCRAQADVHNSIAGVHPLVEGEVREAKARTPRAGRRRSRRAASSSLTKSVADWQPHPFEVVGSEMRRFEGMHRTMSCVVLRRAAYRAARGEVPVSDVVGLRQEFPRIWQQEVTPGSVLERGMIEAVELMRNRSKPPQSFAQMWKVVAAGAPEPSTTGQGGEGSASGSAGNRKIPYQSARGAL